MPIHDWTRVDAGIFHHFHHDWITEIGRRLNGGLLPEQYYALAAQFAAGFGPDVLTLEEERNGAAGPAAGPATVPGGGGVLLAAPPMQPIAETDMAFYRRKQNVVAFRHVSGDRIVAMVEVVSPGNKAAHHPFRAFVEKAAALLDKGVHLLILDLFPPGRRDPQGIHAAIWEAIAGDEYAAPPDRPLTLVSYETGLSVRVYLRHAAVGESLPDMPLFVEPGQSVMVPLESTYQAGFAGVPRR